MFLKSTRIFLKSTRVFLKMFHFFLEKFHLFFKKIHLFLQNIYLVLKKFHLFLKIPQWFPTRFSNISHILQKKSGLIRTMFSKKIKHAPKQLRKTCETKKIGSSEKDICSSIEYFSVYIDMKINRAGSCIYLSQFFSHVSFFSENILFLTFGESGPY